MPNSPLRSVLPAVSLGADTATPLNAQVAQALREAIRGGHMPPCTRLPPSRDAALQLGVGRNTVVDAYADLAAEGLLETRGRQGTFVAALPSAPAKAATGLPRLARVALRRPGGVALPAAPSGTLQDWRLGQSGAQLLPLAVWRTACREAGRQLPPSDYGDPRGHAGLREAIAAWLRQQRGMHCEPRQVIVTQGAAAGIELLARVLLRPGDVCAVECPGYPRAAMALQAAGAVLRPVPVDEQGLRVDQAFVDGPPALLHLTPAHQYPLGGRLSGARRRSLAALVQRHGCLVIDNEYDHEFVHEGQNHPPLAAALPGHAVLVGTFAKSVSPALRMGFLAAPAAIAELLAQAIETGHSQAAWPAQVSMAWMLRSGQLQRHLRRVRRHHAQQRATLLAGLRQRCPTLEVSGHAGGLHLVLSLGSVRQDRALAQRLRQQGIVLQTVQDFGPTAAEDPRGAALVLGYGHMEPPALARAIDALARTCRPGPGPRRGG